MEVTKERLKHLLKLAEIKLDEHNTDYGTKEKYCLCCGSKDYDGIVGVLHYPHCTIRKIREVLKEN
jgi:hypothetical protein